MKKLIKNVEHAAIFDMIKSIDYEEGKIITLTLAQVKGAGITVFAFDAGEEISTHAAGGDALVLTLEGRCEITIDEKKFILNKGEAIVMPAGIPHAVRALTRFKMLLVVVNPV